MSREPDPVSLEKEVSLDASRVDFEQERELIACELHDKVVGDLQAALLYTQALITADALHESIYLDRIAVLMTSALSEARLLLARLTSPLGT